jgi:hypothetical protein
MLWLYSIYSVTWSKTKFHVQCTVTWNYGCTVLHILHDLKVVNTVHFMYVYTVIWNYDWTPCSPRTDVISAPHVYDDLKVVTVLNVLNDLHNIVMAPMVKWPEVKSVLHEVITTPHGQSYLKFWLYSTTESPIWMHSTPFCLNVCFSNTEVKPAQSSQKQVTRLTFFTNCRKISTTPQGWQYIGLALAPPFFPPFFSNSISPKCSL